MYNVGPFSNERASASSAAESFLMDFGNPQPAPCSVEMMDSNAISWVCSADGDPSSPLVSAQSWICL